MLERSFYQRPTDLVARELLGKRLISRVGNTKTGGIIVETEAYLSYGDSACHGVRGKTKSNASMFGQPGIAYVYPIHAGHCFNVVTGVEGSSEAVLIRSLEPDLGLKTMHKRRGRDGKREVTTGPSRLCQALGVTREQDGIDLTKGKVVWIEDAGPADFRVFVTERIGVTSAENLKLRFVWQNHPLVSGPKRLRSPIES